MPKFWCLQATSQLAVKSSSAVPSSGPTPRSYVQITTVHTLRLKPPCAWMSRTQHVQSASPHRVHALAHRPLLLRNKL